MTEKAVEKYLNDTINELNGHAIKFRFTGLNGLPDYLVLLPGGLVYFVTLKHKRNGRLAKLQYLPHRRLYELGLNISITSTIAEIDAWYAKVLSDLSTK